MTVESALITKLLKDKANMLTMLEELRECSLYWSEYDVPLGIVDRLNETIKKVTE